MGLLTAEAGACRTWEVQPNRSLSINGRTTLLLAVAALSGVIALTFTLSGTWPVIPFIAIDLALLCRVLLECLQQPPRNDHQLLIRSPKH